MSKRGRLPKEHPKYKAQGHAIRKYFTRRGQSQQDLDESVEDYYAQEKPPGKKARKETQAEATGITSEDEEWFRAAEELPEGMYDDFEVPARAPTTAMALGGGDGGESGGGGGSGPAPERERPFGPKPHVVTRHYKKSFLVNVDNGTSKVKLTFNTPANARPNVVWNEGWYIIPWGFYDTFLTPNDMVELASNARFFRVKSIKVTLEGMIPFQINLSGGTDTSTATFSNRPNLHIYVDDAMILPDLSGNVKAATMHSKNFTRPWGTGTECMLQSPDFTFNGNILPLTKAAGTFDTAHPQDYFSLYTTGKVKTMYPGQKFNHTWFNPKRAWQSIRGTIDNLPKNFSSPLTGTGVIVEEVINNEVAAQMNGHVGWKGKDYNDLPIQTANPFKNNYYDTGFPVSVAGPPYILCRMEVYPDIGTGGSSIKIYSQMHVHYEAEIEYLPLEKRYGHLNWRPQAFSATTSNVNQIGTDLQDTTAGFAEGRNIGRVAGPGDDDAMWV